MLSMTTRNQLRSWRAIGVLGIILSTETVPRAQERQLDTVVHGDLAPNVTHTYAFRARAGDVLVGTFELRGNTPGILTLHDESGSKLEDRSLRGPGRRPIDFVAPASGVYRLRITGVTVPASYTLSTKKQTPVERVAGVIATPVVRFESPRMLQISKDVSGRQRDAVERFWAEVQAHRGPLIEAIPGSQRDVLVTFLWKQVYKTHNVLIDWSNCCHNDSYMSHLTGTNIWYKTLRLPRRSRFAYRFVPNHRPGEYYTGLVDPLNPRVVYGNSSVFETPDAPDESWFSRAPRVRGTITRHSLDSVLLKRQRDITVYTPSGYSASMGPFALLVLFDGETYLDPADGIGALNTLDNLIADRRIRPTVVCFVSDNRDKFDPKAYADAVAYELLPWLRSAFNVKTDPKDVVIGGYSAGGGAAGSVAFYHSNVFGNVLSQSGGSQVLVGLYMNGPKLPVRFYIDMGLYEYGPTWPALSPFEQAVDGWFEDELPARGENWLQRMRLLRAVLQAKGYEVTYRETGGAHDSLHWRATLAEGLMALLGPSAN